MKIRGKTSISALILFLLLSIFFSSVAYFFLKRYDNHQIFIQYLIWGFVVAFIFWIAYSIVISLNAIYISGEDLIFGSILKKKINIKKIKSIKLKVLYRSNYSPNVGFVPAQRSKIKINSEDGEINFDLGIFRYKDISLIYKQLLDINPSIELDAFNTAILNNEKTGKIYKREVFKNPKALRFAIFTAILLIVLSLRLFQLLTR